MTKTDIDAPLEPAKQTALESLFTNLPDDFEQRQAALERVRLAFNSKLVSEYHDHFWKQARSQPQLAPEDRHALSLAMRERLERLGLSMIDPTLGRPGVLATADTGPTAQGDASYQFYVRDNLGKDVLTGEFKHLPELSLVANGPALTKPFFRWPGSRQPNVPER